MKMTTLINGFVHCIIFLLVFDYPMNYTNEKFPIIQSIDDIIRLFPKSPDDIEKKKNEIIEQTSKSIQDILSLEDSQRTFENTMRALDYASNKFEVYLSTLYTLEMVHPDAIIRNAAHTAIVELQQWSVENLAYNQNVYDAFKAYAQSSNEKLTDEEKYFLQEALRNYEKLGFNLPQDTQERLKQIQKELSELSLNFDTNINTDNKYITATRDELFGVDEKVIEGLKKDTNGLYRVGVDYPTYNAVMQNCTHQKTRFNLWEAFHNRAYPANESILNNVIALRDEKAKLLGFESYAHLDIDDAMAKNPEAVEAFLADLVKRGTDKVAQELKFITNNLPSNITIDKTNSFYLWDWAYILNHLKKEHLNLDEEKIKEYFELNHTLRQLLSIYEEFFSIKFEQLPIKSDDFWHEDVTLVGVYELNKKLIGYILLDLHPRANKYSHACQIDIIPACTTPNLQTPGVAVVLCNFPQGSSDHPALLKRNDVITFFHEFGHALHALFGSTSMIGFSGTRVKRDFVEMPSQMLEYWMWDPEMLKRVSKHYQTGEPLSDALIEKLQTLKQFDAGDQLLRQVFFAYISLGMFLEGAHKNITLLKSKYEEITRPYLLSAPTEHIEASFGHLMNYAAGYYGYQWSKVYAADLFGMMKKYGLTNPEIGKRYREIILARGGSIAPDKLLVEFLGRAPSTQAYFDDLGLVE